MKERIIRTALSLYARYGIKAVSMNSIAAESRISKRTLYEYFPDKKHLISECLQSETEKQKKLLDKAGAETGDPLEAILVSNKLVLKQQLQWCPAFFRDLECFPEVKQQINDQYNSFVVSGYVRNFSRCINENIFPTGVNTNMLLDFFATQSRAAFEKYWSGQMQVIETYVHSVFIFLTGICTDKGREELGKLQSPEIIGQ